MPAVLRAAVPQAVLDYISSWGIDPKWIAEDGWGRSGYYATPEFAHWPDEFVRWPPGFDYDRFLRMMIPSFTQRAEALLVEDRITALEERVSKLERSK